MTRGPYWELKCIIQIAVFARTLESFSEIPCVASNSCVRNFDFRTLYIHIHVRGKWVFQGMLSYYVLSWSKNQTMPIFILKKVSCSYSKPSFIMVVTIINNDGLHK